MPATKAGLGAIVLTRAGDVELLRAHAHDLLSAEQLLGHNGREAAEQVAAAVNDNNLLKHG